MFLFSLLLVGCSKNNDEILQPVVLAETRWEGTFTYDVDNTERECEARLHFISETEGTCRIINPDISLNVDQEFFYSMKDDLLQITPRHPSPLFLLGEWWVIELQHESLVMKRLLDSEPKTSILDLKRVLGMKR